MDLSRASLEELNAELARRTAGPESMDMFFSLPDWIDSFELRTGYEIIVARMRKEAEHVPLNTLQSLLVERVAFNYVALKYMERVSVGEAGGFESTDVLKNWNTYWLKMTQEFNNLLIKFKPDDRKAVLGMVKNIMARVLNSIEDDRIRIDVFTRLAREFDALENA